MNGYGYGNEEPNKQPREPNYGIGNDILIAVYPPEDNYKSVDSDSLDNQRIPLTRYRRPKRCRCIPEWPGQIQYPRLVE